MLIVCAIGYGVLIFIIGIYAFFGGWKRAWQDSDFSFESSLKTSSGDSGGGCLFMLLFLAIEFLISPFLLNFRHTICLFLGILAGTTSANYYSPPLNESMLGAGIFFTIVWRIYSNDPVEKPFSQEPRIETLTPQQNDKPASAPTEPEHSDLNQVYEICTMYLVALDEQFTPEEQDKVDEHFGIGTADRFIKELPSKNWKEQFSVLHDLVGRLSPYDRFKLKTHGRTVFQSILSADDYTASEKTRFDEILRFLDESMGHEPLT